MIRMNDAQFNRLTEKVASLFPFRKIDREIARLMEYEKPTTDNSYATIESDVWGWKVLQHNYWDDGWTVVLTEGLKTLDDAITICNVLGITYKVFDIQKADPL